MRFFPHTHYGYANVLDYMKLHTLRDKKYHIYKLVFVRFSIGFKFVLSLLHKTGFPSSSRKISESSDISVGFPRKSNPSAAHPSVSNFVLTTIVYTN
jgi:hypothetical protein